MRDEVTAAEIRNRRQQNRIVWTMIPPLFFAYEAVIGVLSLFVASIAIVTNQSDIGLLLHMSPTGFFASVLAVAGFKLFIARGLYRKYFYAWAIAIGLGVIGILASITRFFGGFESVPLSWLLLRFESGGNLFIVLDVLIGMERFQWFVSLVTMGMYAGIAYKLYTQQSEFLDWS
jgi:hypothetical protein